MKYIWLTPSIESYLPNSSCLSVVVNITWLLIDFDISNTVFLFLLIGPQREMNRL